MKGKVLEVRNYDKTIYLFVQGISPEPIKDKMIKFELNTVNFRDFELAKGLMVGAEIIITKKDKDDIYDSYYQIEVSENCISADTCFDLIEDRDE